MQSPQHLSHQQISEEEHSRREKPQMDSLGQKWTQKQNKIYYEYLQQNFLFFKTQRLRKQYQVFSELGKIIGTRTSKQVKTHHNRLLRRFKSLEQILKQLPKFIQIDDFSIPHSFKFSKPMKKIQKIKSACIVLDSQQQKREKQSPLLITVEEEVLLLEQSVQKQDWELLFEF